MKRATSLRLAVYGLVAGGGVSWPSGHHHLLTAKLDRDHTIELQGSRTASTTTASRAPAFCYIPTDAAEPAWIGRLLGDLTGFPARIAQMLRGAASVARA